MDIFICQWVAILSANYRTTEEPITKANERIVVNLGVLLPFNDVKLSQEPCFRVQHLFPTATLAIRETRPFFSVATISRIKVWFVDSNCSDTIGPLNAMKLVSNMEINAFFGPCCKYVLSPVARYSKVWKTPVITPGGLTPAFKNKTTFPLLTRIMAPYDKLASFVVSIMEYYKWTYYSLLWHDHHLRPHLGKSECNQMADALIRETRTHKRLADPNKETFDEGYFNYFDWRSMLNGIRNNSRSKFFIKLLFASEENLLTILRSAALIPQVTDISYRVEVWVLGLKFLRDCHFEYRQTMEATVLVMES